jgi:hypothetical protein
LGSRSNRRSRDLGERRFGREADAPDHLRVALAFFKKVEAKQYLAEAERLFTLST